MTAGKKKPENKNAGTADSKRSLWEFTEKQLACVSNHSSDLIGQTPEKITHDLQNNQIELEIQAEELKKSKLALEESRDKFLHLYDFAPIGLLTVNEKGAIIEVNLTGSTLLGVERSKLLWTRFSKFVAPEDQDQWYSYIKNLLRHEEKQCCTLMLKCKGGSAFLARLEGVRFGSGGIPTEASIAFSDITDMKKAEEALQRTNEFLNNLCDHANAPIIVWDPEFRITRFNPACENLTLRSEREVVGQHLDILFPKESKETSHFQTDKTLEGERWENVEIPILVKDGSVRTVLWNSANIVKPDGSIISTIAQGVDITERKLAEEALRESAIRLDELAEQNNTVVWEVDTKGLYTYVSHVSEAVWVYRPDELVGHLHFYDLHPEPGREAFKVSCLAVFERKELFHNLENVIQTKDGREVWVSTTGIPIVNVDGTLMGYRGSDTEITKRKRTEEALWETEEILQDIIEKNPMSIQIVDKDGITLKVNHAFILLFGSIPPSDFSIFTDLKNKQPELEKLFLLAKSGEVANLPDIYFNVHDSLPDYPDVPVWVRAIIFPLKDKHGKPERFVLMHENITDRKQADVQREKFIKELEQKNAELEQFTYTASHDLKSPLLTIKWYAGLLEDDTHICDPVQMKKDAHRISEAAETMQKNIADLLELSRVGKIIKPPEKTGFGTIVKEALNLLFGPLTERGVTVEIAPDFPNVYVDPTRIREVMVNLIENAIKFLGNRPDPLIRIGVDDSGETPVFFVQDNGIGIDPQYLDRIFNLFERLDVFTHGSGIGLPIVRRIIEVHGGKIWAESEGLGKGTTFRFTLPGATKGERP